MSKLGHLRKREKRLTKKERKATCPAQIQTAGAGTQQGQQGHQGHIHCIACGRHIEPAEFKAPATAVRLACQHRSTFPACAECASAAKQLLAEHDRTGQPVRITSAWH